MGPRTETESERSDLECEIATENHWKRPTETWPWLCRVRGVGNTSAAGGRQRQRFECIRGRLH